MKRKASSHHWPEKCVKCAKSSRSFIHGKCAFCHDLQFKEEILCDLNRRIQPLESFECHGFQPALKLVGDPPPTAKNFSANHVGPPPKDKLEEIINSDRYKYLQSSTRQILTRDPDDIFLQIQYHIVWNVIYRQKAFDHPESMVEAVSDMFSKYHDLARGFACLLWLAPDHVHVYVLSDGKKSIETIVRKMKLQSADSIFASFPDLKKKFQSKKTLWDEAYFVETVG